MIKVRSISYLEALMKGVHLLSRRDGISYEDIVDACEPWGVDVWEDFRESGYAVPSKIGLKIQDKKSYSTWYAELKSEYNKLQEEAFDRILNNTHLKQVIDDANSAKRRSWIAIWMSVASVIVSIIALILQEL